MLPKICIIANIFALKVVLSQTIYNASPAVSYPPNTVSTAQSYPVVSSALAAPTVTMTACPLPSNVPIASSVAATPISAVASPIAGPVATVVATSIPQASLNTVSASSMTASAMPLSTSSMPTGVSPMPVSSSSCTTEAKAYFVSKPIPDPKVTILGDIPSVVEVTPKIYQESPAVVDPGYLEVKATVCKEPSLNLNAPVRKAVLPKTESSPIAPVKRLSMACASDAPSLAAQKIISNHPVCPGISKMDLIPTSAMMQEKKINPIEFDGLLDGFMSCL